MKTSRNKVTPDVLKKKTIKENHSSLTSIPNHSRPLRTSAIVEESDSCSIEITNDSSSSVTSKTIREVNNYSIEISDNSLSSRTSSNAEQFGFHALQYRVTEIPPWKQSILLAFQQTMICMSGILTVPYLVSEVACAGAYTTALRIQLISSTFVVTGFTTLLQTVVGLRLPILQGPSFAFLPPLYSFANLPDFKCNYSSYDHVPEEHYLLRIQIIQGSLACSSLLLLLIGVTGAIGALSKLIGPVTIFPLVMLLCLGTVDVIVEKVSMHWISIM